MEYSNQIVVSDGTLQLVSLTFPYIDKVDVHVSVDFGDGPEEYAPGTIWDWVGSEAIRFDEPLPDGAVAQLQRQTEIGDILNKFTLGAMFNAPTLDENFDQLLYIAQEYSDVREAAGKSLRVPSTEAPVAALPGRSERAGKLVAFDSSGEPEVRQDIRDWAVRASPADVQLVELPSAEDRANKVLTFDSEGQPTAAFPATDSATELRMDLANPAIGAAMVARGVVAVDSIADLLALPEGQRKEGLRYLVRGFYRGKASGGGELYWDPLAPADRHNGVTHYSPEKALEWDGTLENIDALYSPASADGLFIREGHDTLRIPCGWGGVVYGDRDNARALNLLAEAVRVKYSGQADGRFRGRGCVVLSGVDTGRVSTLDTWVIPREIDVEMIDPIFYGGPNDRPAVIHGEEGVAMRMNRSRYSITRDTSNGRWSDNPAPDYQETEIGLVLINQLGGRASFTAYGFEIGVQVLGAGSGASYAKYDVEYLFNNKVALWLHAGDGGWVNENSFYGGNHGSAGSFRNGHACQAVRSTKDGPTGGNNNNTWYSPSFESMGYDPSGDQKPIIDAVRMTCCRFLNIRDENPGSELLYREGPLSNSNEITWGYSGLMDTTPRVQMSSITKNLVYGRDGVTGIQEKMSTVIWDSGSLSDKARTVNGQVVIPDVQMLLLATATDPKSPGWSQSSASVSVGSNGLVLNGRTVGAFIKLNGAKRFIVAMAGENCSLFTTVYDENFNQITDVADKEYLGGRVFSGGAGAETYLGGCYRHSNQIKNENFISVLDDSVKYIGLHCGHGTGGYIDGFKVLVDHHDRAASGVLTQNRVAAGAYHLDSIPVSGDFQLGDTFYTTTPVPGGYVGWRCVEAGSPGVWKGFGKIEE